MNASHRSALIIAAISALALSRPAHALMAGSLPDTAAARVDANTTASPWTSAVSILINGGVYSGAVVAPSYVLTAAHVASGAVPAAITVQINAQSTPVQLAVSAVTTFPSASFPYDDLSLITLATPVPDTVEILPIYRQTPPAHQAITFVGYGWSGNGDTGPNVPSAASVKRSGVNAIDGVQTTIDSSGRTSLFYLFDFDGPAGRGTFGGATLGNALETGLAGGDSGSPVYATLGGQRYLIGINNFTASPTANASVDFKFGTLGGGMLLSDPRFIDWLTTNTQNTLGQPSGNGGDVPLPSWAIGALAAGLAGTAAWRHKQFR